MESFLDDFGIFIIPFIALMIVLRKIYKSARTLEQEADEDQPSTERASGGNSSDFVFSDPLETPVPVARNKENYTLTTAAPTAHTDLPPLGTASPVRAETVADSTKPAQERLCGNLRPSRATQPELLKDPHFYG